MNLLVPLMMGYVTRYVQGTDKLRRNGFEVHGMNGSNTSIIHCDNVKSLSEWVKLISENIANLAEVQVNRFPLLYCSISGVIIRSKGAIVVGIDSPKALHDICSVPTKFD